MTHKSKNELRSIWQARRKSLSPERRQEAALALIDALEPYIQNATHILSYVSFNDELDTSFLNRELAKSKRLILPKVVETRLELYEVNDIESQLKIGAFSILEPDANLCKPRPAAIIEIALIPAIAFDAANHRLGYGKGFYDRFLDEHKNEMTTIGVGFKEQLSDSLIPVENHDIHLSRIVLV